MNKKTTITVTSLAIALIVGLLIYTFATTGNEADKPETIDGIGYSHTVQTIDGKKYITPDF